MTWPLYHRLPQFSLEDSHRDLLDRFLDYVAEKKLELYPAQEEAILELYSGKNVILNTPTGSGKSLVGTALHFKSAAEGKRSFYTSPIKALVNEKFLSLCKEFSPDQVGMITGDATVNPSAPLICCTAEILSNDALRLGQRAPIDDVIMDEFHYYSDRERGVAWQIPLLALPQARFLLMSATLGDTEFFERCLSDLNGRETVVVRSTERPVPLDFEYSDYPLHEVIAKLIHDGRAPIYLVHFTQRECAEQAQNLLSVDFLTKDQKKQISEALEGTRFSSPYGKELQRVLRHGVGIHHGGLLPKYRVLVERLSQKGLLKVICGTDTLGVGVNVPLRTVLITRLCKFDGEKTTLLSVRDFHQISGRAGRKGFDNRGTVVVQAPEHVIENLSLERKAAGDPKKLKKIVKRKPPEKGYLPWGKETFEKLVNGKPEALVSRFQVNHSMLLNVLSRKDEDGCSAMRKLIRTCHESPGTKRKLGKTAFQLFRSLVERKIIEFAPEGLRLHVDLQQDFSLNQALALYLLDAIKLLDPLHPDYALDLLTLVESILENPDVILRKQLNRVRWLKLEELKMQGMEYDERMAEVENLEYPKPNREFIYATFNEFASAHPWVGQENIRPKSVAREMFETFQSFAEYVRDYELQRSEGLLLRYLSDVYKVLEQTVPEAAKSDDVRGMAQYFGTMVRQIDSSLLDEWERMRDPNWVKAESDDSGAPAQKHGPSDITSNRKEFGIRLRNSIFQLVRALASRDYESALACLEPGLNSQNPLTVTDVENWMKPYHSEHGRIRTDTPARAPQHTRIAEEGDGPTPTWQVEQILVDSDGHNDWCVNLRVDLEASRRLGEPVFGLDRIGPLL